MGRSRADKERQGLEFLEIPAATLAKYRIAEELGIKLKIRIKTTASDHSCATCTEIANERYTLDNVPALPLPGCTFTSQCRARYVAELEHAPANDRAANDRRTPLRARSQMRKPRQRRDFQEGSSEL